MVAQDPGEAGEGLARGQAQRPGHPPGFHLARAERGHLLQQAQGVAHRAPGVAGDEGQAFGHRLVPLPGGDVGEEGDEGLRADRVEVEALRAAADGVGQLVRLGGGQDEVGVLRGLLEGLEQGVGRRPREHVRLVEDVHAPPPAGGGNRAHVGPDFADVLHLVVRGGVQFDDVERAALGDGPAGLAHVAGLAVGPQVGTVQDLGDDAGGGGLPGAPRPGEQVGVDHPALLHLPSQGQGHVLLADHVAEPLGPVLSVESLVRHQAIVPRGRAGDGGQPEETGEVGPVRRLAGRVERRRLVGGCLQLGRHR